MFYLLINAFKFVQVTQCLVCVAGAKRGGRGWREKSYPPSFFPIPYPFRRLLRRLLNVQVYTHPSQSEHRQIKKYAHKIPISQYMQLILVISKSYMRTVNYDFNLSSRINSL